MGEAKFRRIETKLNSTRDSLRQRTESGAHAPWLQSALQAPARAQSALDARNYDGAWEALHEARQHEVLGDSDEQAEPPP